LNARFDCWLGDFEAPELLAAIDPARRTLPLLIRGEPGTGRGLLARYLHMQAGTGGEALGCFASVSGGRELEAGPLLAGIVPEIGTPSAAHAMTICIEEADSLSPAVQRRLGRWIENGPPPGLVRGAPLRWMATAGDLALEDRLEPDLARALAGLYVRIPPLRERPVAVTHIAEETAHAWIALRGGSPAPGPPRFSADAMAALHAYPWPGNARELEAVVRRTLATTRSDPVGAAELVFDPLPLDLFAVADDASVQLRDARVEASGSPAPDAAPGGEPRDDARDGSRETRRDADSSGAPSGPTRHPGRAGPATAPGPGPRPAASSTGGYASPAAQFRRLAGAVAHEVGNPLVGIRTYTQMLPTRFDDPEFRQQFTARVEEDTRRIENVVETLTRLGATTTPTFAAVDVSTLISRLLQLHRSRIQEERLVVLEELDREAPHALGDAETLRFALGLLLEEAMSWLAESGDLYVATTHQPATATGTGPRLRILVRSRGGPRESGDTGLRMTENTLAIAAVEAVVLAHHGSLAVESGEPGETLVLIDLPAP
jgi:hypothetical protein